MIVTCECMRCLHNDDGHCAEERITIVKRGDGAGLCEDCEEGERDEE